MHVKVNEVSAFSEATKQKKKNREERAFERERQIERKRESDSVPGWQLRCRAKEEQQGAPPTTFTLSGWTDYSARRRDSSAAALMKHHSSRTRVGAWGGTPFGSCSSATLCPRRSKCTAAECQQSKGATTAPQIPPPPSGSHRRHHHYRQRRGQGQAALCAFSTIFTQRGHKKRGKKGEWEWCRSFLSFKIQIR